MSNSQNDVVSAPPLQMYLLGSFSLRVENEPLALASRKTQSLLAYLALHPGAHAREKLAGMFWGDSTDQDARHSLRSGLNVLRKALGRELLLTDRENVQCNPEYRIWVDALEFGRVETLDAVPELESRVTLYRGDLLADFYDDWILTEREHYRALYLETLLRLARALRAQNKSEGAIAYARAVLQADRANEQAYQELMLSHAARGDRLAALRVYDECAAELRRELNVEPSAETKTLYEWVRARRDATVALPQLVTNLPTPLSSFIGRDQELQEIELLAGTTRLLTLTGAGGSGKTRLAIQVARSLLRMDQTSHAGELPPSPYRDGVWWVELAPLMDGALLPQAIADILGVRETPYQPLTESLLNHLRNQELLLILDNCEHLIEACARLADLLLTQSPNLYILATSREPLAISGETIYQVTPLILPSETETILSPELAENESIRLFVERARAVKTDFALTAQDVAAVVQICRRLDGIPLAIELAAARIKHLSVEQIAARLHDRFGLLTGGSRAALPRHQTLRATIDWSYELLPQPARGLFRRLSVFASAFTLEAAQGVCAWDPLQEHEVLERLSQLVDRSLILVETRESSVRYRMLETIRQYALEKLFEAGEMERTRGRHLEFFLAWTEQAQPHLNQAERGAWITRLDAEIDNLRAALEWSQNPNVEPGLGVRLAGALYELWFHQGYLREGMGWLQAALSRTGSAPEQKASADLTPLARAYYALGRLTHELGDNGRAEPILGTSLQFWQQTIPLNRTGVANTLHALGWLRRQSGELETARALQEKAISLFRETADQAGLAGTLVELALILRDQEDYVHARLAAKESVSVYRALDHEQGLADALTALGLIAKRQGDYAAGIQLFEQALATFRKTGARIRVPYTLHNLATLTLSLDDVALAQAYNQQGEVLFRELGNRDGIVHSLYLNGHIALFQNNVAEAEAVYRRAAELVRQGAAVGWLRGGCLFGLAMIAARRDRYERAARLWGAAEKQRTIASSYWDAAERRLYARTIAVAEERLGKTTFETIRAQGDTLSLEQAIEYALRREDA